MKKSTYSLTFCGIMIGLGAALSMIPIVKLPLGGTVTLLSMLPIVAVSFNFGIVRGLCASFVFSVIQLILGFTESGLLGWGLSGGQLAGCIALDYFAAYTVLGLAGIFGKKKPMAPVYGTALAMALRFLCHFISGVIIFSNFEQFSVFGTTFEGKPILYSICYNGFYMLPETVFTCIAVYILAKSRFFERIDL